MDSSKQAQRAVIQFLSAEGVCGTDVYSRMKNVYGTECMSRTAVFRCCSDFRHGRVSTADMPRPGQAHVVITQESIAAVNSLVRGNHRITTQEIADSLSVSKGTVDTILMNICNTARFVHNGSQNISLRTRSVCEWVFASSIYCVTAQRETTFCPGLWLATRPGAISSIWQ